jgi:four helix bundle protein
VGEKKRKPVKEFDDLHVYQQARSLTNLVYNLTRSPSFERDRSLRDQLRRAAVSVMSNIAEGFERDSDKAFAQGLTIAKGSCGEIRAQMTVALDQGHVKKPDYDVATDACRRLAAGISRLITYLRESSP